MSSLGELNNDTAITPTHETQTIEAFQRFKLSNEYILNAPVQSLADFIPGAILTSPSIEPADTLQFCREVGYPELGHCRKRYFANMAAGSALKVLTLQFEYPKRIDIDARFDSMCKAMGREWRVTVLPDDVDDDQKPGRVIEDEQKLACYSFKNPKPVQ